MQVSDLSLDLIEEKIDSFRRELIKESWGDRPDYRIPDNVLIPLERAKLYLSYIADAQKSALYQENESFAGKLDAIRDILTELHRTIKHRSAEQAIANHLCWYCDSPMVDLMVDCPNCGSAYNGALVREGVWA